MEETITQIEQRFYTLLFTLLLIIKYGLAGLTGGIITEKYINISLVLMNISKCLAYFNLK